jgi:hypothetical protein
MSIMLPAQDQGWHSCPLDGFEFDARRRPSALFYRYVQGAKMRLAGRITALLLLLFTGATTAMATEEAPYKVITSDH